MTTTLEKPTVQPPIVELPQSEQPLSQDFLSDEDNSAFPIRRLWTRADYYKAGELGLFGRDERLELINGEVWKQVSPQGAPHVFGVGHTADLLREAFSTGFHVREEKPLVLDDLTEPQPDIVVVRGTWLQTPNHPTSTNAVLVMEVSETTLKFDQTYKAEAYARSAIPDYWVLNQRARQLEVCRDPGLLGDGQWGYRSLQIVLADGQISPLAAPDIVINVSDLLPSLPQSYPAATSDDSAVNAADLQPDLSDTTQND